MDENLRYVEETDAVHHRLAGESPAVEKNYQCYDCLQSFHSLAHLGDHQNLNWHSLEMCLKCADPITVFIQKFPPKIIRLHSCKKAMIKYENSNLYLLSVQLSQVLCWSDISHTQHQSTVIYCDDCDVTFPQSPSGLFEFLKHCNLTAHNLVSSGSCVKCNMPEYKLTGSNFECCIVHFCTKDSKSVLKEFKKHA